MRVGNPSELFPIDTASPDATSPHPSLRSDLSQRGFFGEFSVYRGVQLETCLANWVNGGVKWPRSGPHFCPDQTAQETQGEAVLDGKKMLLV